MPVDSSKQNKHRWWGILTIDENTEVDGKLKPGDQCVFFKTNRATHFISEGTVIKKLKVYDKTDAKAALKQKAKAAGAKDEQSERFANDLDSAPHGLPIVEILEIDYERTSPLAIQMNNLTETLFYDKVWLKAHGADAGADDIGEEAILMGRKMP